MKRVEISGFSFEIGKIKERLKEMGAEKILLQLPDGLKRKSERFAELFDQEVILWGGSSYGACDVPKDIDDIDALVHVGHSEIPNMDVGYKVLYSEGRSAVYQDIDEDVVQKILEALRSVSRKEKNSEISIGIYASLQYLEILDELKDGLEKEDVEVIKDQGDGRIKYPGQVLGCNYSSVVKEADAHLYIGTGRFHPIGLSLSTESEIILWNPGTGEIETIDNESERLMRKRHAAITKAREAKKIGILVSKKPGQRRSKTAERLKEMCPEEKNCLIVETDEITPSSVDSLNLDCAVSTACPRIALDDSINYKTTLLTPTEFEICIGEKEWTDWKMDEIF